MIEWVEGKVIINSSWNRHNMKFSTVFFHFSPNIQFIWLLIYSCLIKLCDGLFVLCAINSHRPIIKGVRSKRPQKVISLLSRFTTKRASVMATAALFLCVRVIAAARLAAIYFILLQNGHLSFSLMAAALCCRAVKRVAVLQMGCKCSWAIVGQERVTPRESKGVRLVDLSLCGVQDSARREKGLRARGRPLLCDSSQTSRCTWTMKATWSRFLTQKTLFYHT